MGLLAKSRKNGGMTLLEHTRQVMLAVLHFADKLGFSEQMTVLKNGAIMHDLGKAHPKFQYQIREADGEKVWKSLYEKDQWNFIHRHEYSSLLFLPLFPKKDWDVLIELVVAHHKSLKDDDKKRGFLNLADEELIEGEVFDNHSLKWEEWGSEAIKIITSLSPSQMELCPLSNAKEAWDYALAYCQKRYAQKSWSQWRGLLMAADHFASAMNDHIDQYLAKTFQIPDLSPFDPTLPGGKLFPLSDIPVSDPRKHSLVVAPTGAGKTNFLLRRCKGRRVFYTLPFQASINAMYHRMKEALPEADVRLLHAASRITLHQTLDLEQFEEEYPLQGLVGAAVKVLTPHQLASVVFGTPGFEAALLDLQGTAVILDEIHTYSEYSQSMVLEIIKVLIRFDCSIHIGTATMPTPLYDQLLNLMGGTNNVYEVALNEEQLASYNRHYVEKIDSWEDAEKILEDALHSEEKILMVCNTIAKAQKLYESLKERFGDYPNMLIHSRFRRKDRADKEFALRKEFEGEKGKGHRPCWVVATQVVEVSLDISFDRMITDCAPIDALIQRFGRINRRRTEKALGTQKTVHIIKPEGSQKPYNGNVVRRTFDVLPDRQILPEKDLQSLIDQVYPEIKPAPEIDMHLAWDGDRFKLGGLTNRKSSVLAEALDIESATCILESDREAYEQADWIGRSQLEIPVSWSVAKNNTKEYIQLDIGSRPFIVPQLLDDYEELGLVFRKYDVFL